MPQRVAQSSISVEKEAGAPKGRSGPFGALNSGIVLGGFICLVFLGLALTAQWITPHSPDHTNLLMRLKAPSAEHWLGTDALGRDVLTRLIYGSRVSLIVGVGGILASALVGVPLGIAAGYLGGRIDTVIMRLMDLLLSVPKLLVAILIMAVTGPGIGNLIFAIGLWNVPVFSRLTRSTTLSLRERDFVAAAEAVGNPSWRVMFRHVLPNTVNEIIVTGSLSVAAAIMAESGLSFLGLGVPPHIPSWGMMLSEGRSYLRTAPHVTTFSGLFIMLAVLGFNLLGDGLRDLLDPRRKQRGRRGKGR